LFKDADEEYGYYSGKSLDEMNILLIYPNITEYPIDMSNGLASISAVLKSAGHQVELLDFTFKPNAHKIVQVLYDVSPALIGIPVSSNDFDYAIAVCSFIKKHSNAPIVCGGWHTTIATEEVLNRNCFDIAVIGDGEYAMLEIATSVQNNLELDSILGVWFKRDGKIIKNPLRPLMNDISQLPIPDKELFAVDKYLRLNRGLATFITSLGCPFECSYCINHVLMNKFGKKDYIRYKSVDYLIKEIQSITQRYKVREIEFYDDTFTLNKMRLLRFCDVYKNIIKLPFHVNTRVDTIDEEIVLALKKAGCNRIAMGIESGDRFIRNTILKRNQTDESIINAFLLVKKVGIQTLSFNMLGIPFETYESINQTIQLNRKCKPDFVAISIFNAFERTDLHDLCKRNGWLKSSNGMAIFKTSNVKHPNFTIKELKKMRDRFGYEVFKAYNYKRALIDLIDKTLANHKLYVKFRSFLIRWGIKKLL
jgi:anaerobic magnesium-protoporphyrin IX monomethyl ester cyclase